MSISLKDDEIEALQKRYDTRSLKEMREKLRENIQDQIITPIVEEVDNE